MIKAGQIYKVNTRVYAKGLYILIISTATVRTDYLISVGLPINGKHCVCNSTEETKDLIDRGYWILVPSCTKLTLRR